VKYGNTKDPTKRAVILQEKEAEHAQASIDHWRNAEERAALNPLTAEVLCIGVMPVDGTLPAKVFSGTEKAVLTEFWTLFVDPHFMSEPFVFWSGTGDPYQNFDADMVIRRSWLAGVPVPASVFAGSGGRYLSSRFIDAAGRYLLGKREAFCSLSDAADQLGVFERAPTLRKKDKENDPVTGANFHLWWDGLMPDSAPDHQRELAAGYLQNDLALLRAIAARIL